MECTSKKKVAIPILSLDYPLLKKVIFAADLAEIVPLAFLSERIRKLISGRDYGTVKVTLDCVEIRGEMMIEFRDGSSMKVLFYEYPGFPNANTDAFYIKNIPFKLSRSHNSSIIYADKKFQFAAVMFLDALIQLFGSSRVELKVDKYYYSDPVEPFVLFQSIGYIHQFEVHGHHQNDLAKHLFSNCRESYFLEASPEFLAKKKLPHLTFDDSCDEKWLESILNADCRKLEMYETHFYNRDEWINIILKKWQKGENQCYQYVIFHENIMNSIPTVYSTMFKDINNVSNWEQNGKGETFNRLFDNRLLHGGDVTREDGKRASAFTALSPDPKRCYCTYFITWRPLE